MIRGLLHGIKRFWSRRVLTRRPSCHRKRGGFMGRAGIDLFIEDGAYTTLSSAVVILVVLTLLFSSTAANLMLIHCAINHCGIRTAVSGQALHVLKWHPPVGGCQRSVVLSHGCHGG